MIRSRTLRLRARLAYAAAALLLAATLAMASLCAPAAAATAAAGAAAAVLGGRCADGAERAVAHARQVGEGVRTRFLPPPTR